MLATLGRTWQPFGGSGYFVLLAMLALTLLLSTGLIGRPLAFTTGRRVRSPAGGSAAARAGVFRAAGAGVLLVEFP